MKKIVLILATAMVASLASSESVMKPFNDKDYGTLSGRLQSLSMYRDYDNGLNNYSTTLGLILNYVSPEMEGWSLGAAYNGAGVLNSMDYGKVNNPGEALVANGRISVLNEGYLNYNLQALGLTNTTATLGRRINNAEIFRADDIRQKARSIEAIQAESKDVENWRFAGGHAFEQSGILDIGNRWKFRDYGKVFGKTYDTDGVTWGETSYTGIEKLDVALFDAVAWDVANMIGTRAKYDLNEKTALLGYYRNEFNIGRAAGHSSNVLGLSLVQKVGQVKLEGGYFGVYGDTLEFNQLTTGFNHALGASLMIYTGQYVGGADTFYIKATTKLEETQTILYTLCNYTILNKGPVDNAMEFDFIAKQPVGKNLTVCGKAGLGYRDAADTLATDLRLFLTYAF